MDKLYEIFKLSENEIIKLNSFSIKRHCSKGEILFYEDEKLEYLYFLETGCIMSYKVDSNNKKIVLHTMCAPCFVGISFCILNMPTGITTEWLSDGSIIKIDYQKFDHFFLDNPKISRKLLELLSKKLFNYSDFVIREKFSTATEKVAFFIKNRESLFLSLSLGEVSIILNIQQPTLSNILKIFKELDILENKKNKIVLKNKAKLDLFLSLSF